MDGPLDHSTGKGGVKDHAYGPGGSRRMQAGNMGAQYYDAKWVKISTSQDTRKKAITLVLVETLGGIAPPTKQFIHVFAKEAAGTNTRNTDATNARTGTTGRCMERRRRASASSFE